MELKMGSLSIYNSERANIRFSVSSANQAEVMLILTINSLCFEF
jgi:hypothetical protein